MTESTASLIPHQSQKKTITATAVGNVLEWFDFASYGYLAPFIGPLFFPSHDPVASMLDAFAVLAIGYLARPVGALVLGWVGDMFGRRKMLIISIMILGASSCSIGLLPTHASIGRLAPVLLILLRLAQGFSVGGEYTGSMAYSCEVAKSKNRGLLSSLATTGATAGLLLSVCVIGIVTMIIGNNALKVWGWRIPFLMGFIIMCFGLIFLTKIPETLETDQTSGISGKSVISVLRNFWRDLLRVIIIVTGSNIAFYIVFVFCTDMALQAGNQNIEKMNIIAMLVLIPSTILGGWLSDRFGRKRVSLICNLILAIIMTPVFSMCFSFTLWPSGPALTPYISYLIGLLLISVPMGIILGVQGVMISELIPKQVRCTIFSVSYSLAMGIFAGTAPMISEWMVKREIWDVGPSIYTIIWLVPAIVVISSCRETAFTKFN
jgi:MFS transporter, MHS family, proline/betaine transporter